jgi:hypothetical protein
MTPPKILFLTFADGSPEFLAAGKRILGQANGTPWFDSALNFDDSKLARVSSTYLELKPRLNQLIPYPLYFRAAKTFLVQSALEGNFGKYDCILYADAGCEFLHNKKSEEKFYGMVAKAMDSGGFAEQLEAKEWQYSKASFLEQINATESEKNSGQVQATFHFWRQDRKSLQLANEWVEWTRPELNYWQNPASDEFTFSGFVSHRHDQSLLSILWKRYQFSTSPVGRSYSGHTDLFRSVGKPIHTLRNRTGIQTLPDIYQNDWISNLNFFERLLKSRF